MRKAENAEQIRTMAASFQSSWNSLVLDFPVYHLDGTWASLSVVDLILSPLRKRTEFSEQDQANFLGAVSYLATLIAEAWSNLGEDVEVGIEASLSDGIEIEVVARGLPQADAKHEFRVPLYSLLRELMRTLPNPLPIYRDQSLIIGPDTAFIAPLLSGIGSAASPFVKGGTFHWAAADITKYEAGVNRYIAQSLARGFERLYPSDEILSAPEFFLTHLALPPLVDDVLPALLPQVAATVAFLGSENLAHISFRPTLLRLARSADTRCAQLGLALLASTLRQVKIDETFSLTEAQGAQMPRLRQAIVLARHLQGIEGDFRRIAQLGKIDAAKYWFDIDHHLGLYPDVSFLLIENIGDPSYEFLFQILSTPQPRENLQVASIETNFPSVSAKLILVHAELAIRYAQQKDARNLLHRLETEFSGLSKEERATYYYLQGICEADQSPQDRMVVFEQVLLQGSIDRQLCARAATQLCLAYFEAGQAEKAWKAAEEFLAAYPSSFGLQLLLANLEAALYSQEEPRYRTALIEHCPFNPVVFKVAQSLFAV